MLDDALNSIKLELLGRIILYNYWKVHCLKQTAEPSLCSVVGVCLGIMSAGACIREMLLAAPGGTCRTLRRGGMGLIDVDRSEI